MVKSFRLLKVSNWHHCAAHALHLLLTVDSVSTVESICTLLQKCRNVVTALHFKSSVVEEELTYLQNKDMIEKLKTSMAETHAFMELDDQFPLPNKDNEDKTTGEVAKVAEVNEAAAEVVEQQAYKHQSLKSSIPTRWNSTLTMVESITDLKAETQNALKRIICFDLCFTEIELSILLELKILLGSFKTFTDICSSNLPMLFVAAFMKKIRNICSAGPDDSEDINKVKKCILKNLDKRFPDSDEGRIQQLLDPDIKGIIPCQRANTILEKAINSALTRKFVKLPAKQLGKKSEAAEEVPSKQKRLELIAEMKAFAVEVETGLGVGDCESESTLSEVAMEVTNYLTMRPAHTIYDVLSFWKENRNTFPILSQLSELYLSISAGSVPVECLFSTTGLVMNGKKSQLGPDIK